MQLVLSLAIGFAVTIVVFAVWAVIHDLHVEAQTEALKKPLAREHPFKVDDWVELKEHTSPLWTDSPYLVTQISWDGPDCPMIEVEGQSSTPGQFWLAARFRSESTASSPYALRAPVAPAEENRAVRRLSDTLKRLERL